VADLRRVAPLELFIAQRLCDFHNVQRFSPNSKAMRTEKQTHRAWGETNDQRRPLAEGPRASEK
jgi:hypothetical protein